MIKEYVKLVLYVNNETVIYDLKNEFKPMFYIFDSDSNIEKQNKYKKYKPTHDNNSIDCDVSELAVYIYYNAWNFLKSVSVNAIRPTRQYNKKYVRNRKYQLIVNHNHNKQYYRGDTMTSFSVTYNYYEKHFKNNTKVHEQIEILAKRYHTIGNMIQIPSCFNTQRIEMKAKYDFWDLALKQIYEWYKLKLHNVLFDKPIRKLFNLEEMNNNF